MKFIRKDKRIIRILIAVICLCVLILLGSCFFSRGKTAAPAVPAETGAPLTLEDLLGQNYVQFLTDTITMQMENRMEKNPEVRYYPVVEDAPLSDYVIIGEETQFEVDAEGYLVIRFPAGTVAAPAHGEQHFRIIRVTASEVPAESPEPAADWKLVLVNSDSKLPEGYSVELAQLGDGQAIDARAYPDLQQMMDDARAAGLSPVICSSYRTAEMQESLYSNKVSRLLEQGYTQDAAETEAARWVAVPGTSEHQLGLAVDIVAESYQVLDEQQENTAEQMWLLQNAHLYGFILRYPEDKSLITGIGYEPWHYRYVGKEAAKQIYENGLCLEEFLEQG